MSSRHFNIALLIIVFILIVVGMVSCNLFSSDKVFYTPEPTLTPAPSPTPMPKTGGYFDTIFLKGYASQQAFDLLIAGELDIYAKSVSALETQQYNTFNTVNRIENYGTAYEISLNTADTRSDYKELNPFVSKKLREAVNYLVDREYISAEIFNGTALPKYTPIHYNSADYVRYIDLIRQIEYKYAFNKAKALDTITRQMHHLGAVLDEEDMWSYRGQPVILEFIIRKDDPIHVAIGDYIANELESVGFAVNKQYLDYYDAVTIWGNSEPSEGLWHISTGNWLTTGIERDSSNIFQDGYTSASTRPYKPYRALEVDEQFWDVAEKLAHKEWTSLDDRRKMFETALFKAAEYSNLIWVVQTTDANYYNADIQMMHDIAINPANNQYNPYTMIPPSDTLPLNWGADTVAVTRLTPFSGSDNYVDRQYLPFCEDYGLTTNPYNGLPENKWIDSARIILNKQATVQTNGDWANITYVNNVIIPHDVIIGWEHETQTFIHADTGYISLIIQQKREILNAVKNNKESTEQDILLAQQAYDDALSTWERGYETAMRKSIVTYKENLFDLKWHDGTNLSLADFVMSMIMRMELSNKNSAFYDESIPSAYLLPSDFKGFRIVSQNPLTIEYYSDAVHLDVENNVESLWPVYGSVQSPWHIMAVSLLALQGNEVAFSQYTADQSESVQWINYLYGDSMDILNKYAHMAHTNNYIPFASAMKPYLTDAQAEQAYGNLIVFYDNYHHYALGLGPYMIKQVDMEYDQMTLTSSPYYPLLVGSEQYQPFSIFPSVTLNGESEYTLGNSMLFDIYITEVNEPKPYPTADVQSARYLLFDDQGKCLLNLPLDQFDNDSGYRIHLTDYITEPGNYTLEILVVSRKTIVPATTRHTFQVVEAE